MGDKKTIGITKANHGRLQKLIESGRFGSELDAAKFAMAYAIREGSAVGSVDGAGTKWHVGAVDPTGDLREMIAALIPEAREPYRVIEFLMNKGIEELVEESGSPDVFGALFE